MFNKDNEFKGTPSLKPIKHRDWSAASKRALQPARPGDEGRPGDQSDNSIDHEIKRSGHIDDLKPRDMLNKDNETQATPSAEPVAPSLKPSKSPGMPSTISADLKVVGDLHCAGDVQVEGKVEGDIQSKSVTVGEGANVSGTIRAESVQVSGTVKGQIEATSVILAKTAKVSGDVVHQTLTVEAGAQLEGHCSQLAEEKKAAPETKAPDLRPAPRDAPTASTTGNGAAPSAAS